MVDYARYLYGLFGMSASAELSTRPDNKLGTDEEWLADKRTMDGAVAGTPAEVTEILGRYRDAGCDEFIIPDFTMGSMPRRKETCDLFINEVAPSFR